MNPRSFVLLVVALLAIIPARAYSQTTISGRVLDADGKPAANVEVLLHAITESTGSQIDRDTSRSDGSFDLNAGNVNPKSIYFVAVKQNGELYMGELLRPPFPAGQEYIVRVGVDPVDFRGAPGAGAPPQDPGSRTAGAVVIAVATLLIGSVLFAGLRRRPPESRRLLVELARLEEEIDASGSPSGVMEKRRRELRNRLTRAESG